MPLPMYLSRPGPALQGNFGRGIPAFRIGQRVSLPDGRNGTVVRFGPDGPNSWRYRVKTADIHDLTVWATQEELGSPR